MEVPQGTKGTADHRKELPESLGRKRGEVPVSAGRPRSKFLACLQPLESTLGAGANTVWHCSMTPHTRGARGRPLLPGGHWGIRGHLRCCTFLPSWAQQNTGLKGWRGSLEVTPNPHGCQGTVRAGVSWGLQPLSTWSRVPPSPPQSWGLLLPGAGRAGAGTWWQDVSQRGLLERGQVKTGALSVGNRGLQLL